MIIKTGTTRRVFVFRNIVIKVARIYWSGIVCTIKLHFFWEIKWIKKGLPFYLDKKRERRLSHKTNLVSHIEEISRKEKQMHMKVLPGKKYEQYCTVSYYLLAGIMANYHERKFYRQTKNIFVMPTYFSFLGLFNIQKRGKSVDFWERGKMWGYLYDNSEHPNQPFCDGHTLAEPENYCIDNGKLKLVDYGDRQVAEFLKINGENLYKNFKHPD